MSIDCIYVDREDPAKPAEVERVSPQEFQQLCSRNFLLVGPGNTYHVPHIHRDEVFSLLATWRREAVLAGPLTRRDRYVLECLKLAYSEDGDDEDIAKWAVALADTVLAKVDRP